MKTLKGVLVGSAATVLVVIGLLVAYRNWKASLYQDMTPAKIADLETSNFAMLIIGILLVLVVVVILWAARVGAHSKPQREEPIEGAWRELPGNQQAQLPPPYQIPQVRRVSVPVVSYNGKGAGTHAAVVLNTPIETEDGRREEIECSVKTLQAAADILAAGKQPTRASFNEQGIMASMEIKSAVDFLRAHEWIAPGAKGTPARWVDGLTADTAQQLHEWITQWER